MSIQVPPGVCCQQFRPLTIDNVISDNRRLPDKSSSADLISTPVLKQVADLVASFFVELFNRYLCNGLFPAAFKEAFITPIVKKR